MLARARGAADEDRLSGEWVLGFQRTVRPFPPRELSGSSPIVGRKRGLEARSRGWIRLENPLGCNGGRIGTHGWGNGLLTTNLRRAAS